MSGIGLTLFVLIVAMTLVVTYWAAKRTNTASEFYTAGGGLTGWQNGLAIAGDYLSAASFLGIAGAIALFGFDGFFYSIGYLVAYLVVLYIVAEPLRNLGKYTIADMISARFSEKKVRGVAAISTLTIVIFYMIASLFRFTSRFAFCFIKRIMVFFPYECGTLSPTPAICASYPMIPFQ